jgi:hypothetical protein
MSVALVLPLEPGDMWSCTGPGGGRRSLRDTRWPRSCPDFYLELKVIHGVPDPQSTDRSRSRWASYKTWTRKQSRMLFHSPVQTCFHVPLACPRRRRRTLKAPCDPRPAACVCGLYYSVPLGLWNTSLWANSLSALKKLRLLTLQKLRFSY